MYDITKLVSKKVWKDLLLRLPSIRQKKYGRKRISKEALLNGILQVLVNGVSWGKIAFPGCSYVSCFRYFQELQRRGKFKLIFRILSHNKTDIEIGSIDTTTVQSFEFIRGVGWNGKDRVVGRFHYLLIKMDSLVMLFLIKVISIIRNLYHNI